MNGLLIFFDGIPQDLDNFNGTESASFVFRRKDEVGDSAFSFAPELTVVGDTYEYVRQQIINAPNPNIAAIQVLIYDTCCTNPDGSDRLLFTGKIEGGSVRWCTFPTCEAQVTVVDNSEDALAIRCLKNNFPWSIQGPNGLRTRGYDEFRYAPYINYCNDVKPESTHEFIIVLTIIFFILFAPIVAVINFVGVLSGDASNYFNQIGALAVACNKRHMTPYVHSQMYNLCRVCGLGFQSSLFDVGGYYHDTVRLDAAYVPGSRFPELRYDNINRPNLNGIQFLDEFKEFNIDWRVVNGVLQVERKDYFSGVEWFNTDNLQNDQLLSICFESLGERPAAYAEYEYAKDSVDLSADEVARKWVDRVIDWNVNNNPQQTGLFSKTFQYSAAQFRYDVNRIDPVPIDKPGISFWFPVLQEFEWDSAMLMSKGTSNFPKLLDIEYVLVEGRVNSQNRGIGIVRKASVGNSPLRAYNYRWWVKENPYIDAVGQQYDTAYQRLLYIDDPRLTSVKTRKVTISVTADCDLLTSLDIDKYVTTSQGQVQITEITYDTNNNSLTINGLI